MEISVVVLTRNRPARLITCITAFDTLSSGENNITYFVRYDDDDEATPRALSLLHDDGFKTIGVKRPRPITMGQAWNECLPAIKAKGFDALSIMSEDVFTLTPQWDRGIPIMLDRGLEAFCWSEYNDPSNANFPILSRKWVEAAGILYPEWFPFWFSDTWLSQVYEFALGQPMFLVQDMVMGGRHGKTQGMRDFQFWLDFWKATRGQRAREGEEIRRKLGWPEIDTGPTFAKFERLDQNWNVAAIEEARGADNASPPTERYLVAKCRAEQWLRLQDAA